MRKARIMAVMLAGWIVATPALANDVFGWQPDEMSKKVREICTIDTAFYRLERLPDGRARVLRSPSLTSKQNACADEVLRKWQIPSAP